MNKKHSWKGARFKSEEGSSTDRRVFNIKLLDGYYCNKNYTLELNETFEITDQGMLLIGKLKPKIVNFPEFWFRWDAKKDELDIDMYDDSKCKIDWKNSGYEGHKTVKTKKDEKNFKVLIKGPNLQIFKGEISFNLARELNFQETEGIHDQMIKVKNPPDKKSP